MMNVNWLGLLGEYLLPLLVLVPLALVVLFVATRSRRRDPRSARRSESLRPRETGPVVRRSSAPWTGQMPEARTQTTRPFLDTAPLPGIAPTQAPARSPAPPPVSMAEPVAVPWPAPAPAPAPVDPPVAKAAPAEAPVSAAAAYPVTEPAALDDDWRPPVQGFAPTEPAGLDGLNSPQADAYAQTEVAGLDSPLARRFEPRTEPAAGLALPRRRASDRLPGPAAPTAGPIPVLIVDDSAVVRAKLGKLLTSNGYAVTAARHGADALEQLNHQWFAMMITDLEMPEMDGFELIEHVSGDLRTENMPVVAITGHEALQAKVQYAQGLYGIFKKPWNDRELLQRVGVLTQLRPRT
jgi:CheY-like chemotaxis protein